MATRENKEKEADQPTMYNHAFTLGFSIVSEHDVEDSLKIPQEEIFLAIVKRCVDLLRCNEMHEAIGAPFDSFVEGD